MSTEKKLAEINFSRLVRVDNGLLSHSKRILYVPWFNYIEQ